MQLVKWELVSKPKGKVGLVVGNLVKKNVEPSLSNMYKPKCLVQLYAELILTKNLQNT